MQKAGVQKTGYKAELGFSHLPVESRAALRPRRWPEAGEFDACLFVADGFAADPFAVDRFAAEPFATDRFDSDPFAADGFAVDRIATDRIAADLLAPSKRCSR